MESLNRRDSLDELPFTREELVADLRYNPEDAIAVDRLHQWVDCLESRADSFHDDVGRIWLQFELAQLYSDADLKEQAMAARNAAAAIAYQTGHDELLFGNLGGQGGEVH